MPSTAQENNKRIAKNTMFLYVRMFFIMAVSLYTSRVVLSTLGVDDFGIYNVVGGVVSMFGFLNGALAVCTQRYLNYELGKGDANRLQKVFITSLTIHALISIIVVILAETIGLWFLYNKMTIPDARMNAAFWVYQFSIITTVVLMMSVPYNAAIIAHEKMSAFAYISVLEVILRLAIVFLLQIGNFDRLIFYAFLMLVVQMSIRVIYGLYCNKHFCETKFRMLWDGTLFREMLGFSGWSIFGNLAGVASTQGLNILLNMFFNPIVNAARGISVQVQNALMQFSVNFQTAMNPQITKSYATGDYNYMHGLIYRSSKFTFFLLYLLSLPIILESDTILHIWLKVVPDYTVPFLHLILIASIINSVANPLMAAANATGNIRVYQTVVGCLILAILPISYVVLKLGGDPVSVFVVNLVVLAVAFIVRLFIVRSLIHLSITAYCKQVIVKCGYVCVLSIILPILLKHLIDDRIVSLFVVCTASMLSVAVSSYYIGLTEGERSFVREKINVYVSRLRQ